LLQNYPNPFNPTTRLRFALPSECFVRLEVFDLLGRRIAVVREGVEPPGVHEVEWRREGPSGLYLYRLEALPLGEPSSRFVAVKKMILSQ
jgi:hypothetical protein